MQQWGFDMQHLSIVNIIHADYLDLINELAKSLGMGAKNISVPLSDGYFACHSWWTQEKYNQFKNHSYLIELGVDMTRYGEALDNLHEFVIDTEGMENIDNVPMQNFENALSELNLTQEKALD